MITNKSHVRCNINNKEYNFHSNDVNVVIIEPIIAFTKCAGDNKVIVVIKNNSGTDLYNVNYYLCSIDNIVNDSIYINDIKYDCLILNNTICLGTIKNAEEVKLVYQTKDDNDGNCASLLSYNYMINNQLNRMYLKGLNCHFCHIC